MNMTYEDMRKANSLINTTNIKGKEYASVAERIKAFRSVFPMGTIKTEIVDRDEAMIVMRATVSVGEFILGTGTAYEKEGSSNINRTSFIENCETSAVGRALGMCGFGIDTSVASADETATAQLQQAEIEPITFVQINALTKRCESDGIDIEKLLALYKRTQVSELTQRQHENIINNWKEIVARCR